MRPQDQLAHPQTILAEQHSLEALELRLRGKSYRQIAAELGMTGGGVYKAVERALRSLSEETTHKAKELRALELARLDAIQDAIWEHAIAGSLEHIKAFLKVSERRAKLSGLDAPVKVKNVDQLTDQDIVRQLAVLAGGVAGAAAGGAAAGAAVAGARGSAAEISSGEILPALPDPEAD